MNTLSTPATNALAESSSAYLRSAAHQPIHWQEFGQEAFDRARELDRPILLDIGAIWCHWCHVIDRESYDDPEIAALINENYVAIKVDRDQRPDVDARCQQAVISLTGHGGWPLTGFLTHEGRLIYGGTYFPPQTMKSLLQRVASVYHERKDDMFAEAEPLEEIPDSEPATASFKLDASVLQTMADSCQRVFDPVFGGLGQQPKFPHHSALNLLITLKQHPQVVTQTLTHMALGGLYDQLAGGFHRYSVDREWHVPHFEKMAYDNAEALTVYSRAYQRFQDPLYRETAIGILDWLWADLSNQAQGGFYASQDADIDLNDDGDHFTWSIDEARAILTPQEFSLIQQYYALDAQGDMHDWHRRNVLRVTSPLNDCATKLGLKTLEAETLLTAAQAKMRAARQQRPVPFIDKTFYTHWNAMLLCGVFEALQWLGLDESEDEQTERYGRTHTHALKTLDRLLDEFLQRSPDGTINQVLHTTGIDSFLDDVTWLLNACLSAYTVTLKSHYLEEAQKLAPYLLDRFEDSDKGGFWDTPTPAATDPKPIGLLAHRRKPAEDNPSSSANAMAIEGLLRLSMLVDDTALQDCYRASAEKALRYIMPRYARYGYYTAALGQALNTWLNPPLKLVVAGEDEALITAAKQAFYPGKLIKQVKGEAGQAPSVQVCIGTRCWAPVRGAGELEKILATLNASI